MSDKNLSFIAIEQNSEVVQHNMLGSTFYKIIFSVSSSSSCSTPAPSILTLPHDLSNTKLDAEVPSKRRRIENKQWSQPDSDFVTDYSDEEGMQRPRKKEPQTFKNKKNASKKSHIVATCRVCNIESTKTFSVRNDSLWLYEVIFPGKNLNPKDRLCSDCQTKFKVSPCANCEDKGASYWLPPAKVKDACKAFNRTELQPGRLCYQCGDKLSKYMKKR